MLGLDWDNGKNGNYYLRFKTSGLGCRVQGVRYKG